MTEFTITRKVAAPVSIDLTAEERLELQKWVEDRMQEFFAQACGQMRDAAVFGEAYAAVHPDGSVRRVFPYLVDVC